LWYQKAAKLMNEFDLYYYDTTDTVQNKVDTDISYAEVPVSTTSEGTIEKEMIKAERIITIGY